MDGEARILYLLYDGYAGFELVFVANNLANFNTATVGFGRQPCRSLENLRTVVDMDVEDIDPSKVDLLVIPGGHPSEIVKDPSLGNKVQAFLGKVREIDRRGGKLAAICGGPQWLALAGVLKGRRCTHSLERPGPEFEGAAFTGEYLTVDRNIITAQGQAYAEFAVEMGRQTGVYSREEDAQSDLDWMRDRKRDRC